MRRRGQVAPGQVAAEPLEICEELRADVGRPVPIPRRRRFVSRVAVTPVMNYDVMEQIEIGIFYPNFD